MRDRQYNEHKDIRKGQDISTVPFIHFVIFSFFDPGN